MHDWTLPSSIHTIGILLFTSAGTQPHSHSLTHSACTKPHSLVEGVVRVEAVRAVAVRASIRR
jgi:hypothetical protein